MWFRLKCTLNAINVFLYNIGHARNTLYNLRYVSEMKWTLKEFLAQMKVDSWVLLAEYFTMRYLFSSDGQHAEIVDDARSARRLSAGVFEQLCGRLSSQTGESGEQRLVGGLGQIPCSCQALCQPHHQTEVSQWRLPNSRQTMQEFLLCYKLDAGLIKSWNKGAGSGKRWKTWYFF